MKKLNSCRKTKCAQLYRRKLRESKKFDIEHCTDKFYESSSYKQLFDEYAECGRTKCKKEKLHHKKTMDNTINFYATHNITPMDNVPNN